MVTPNPPDYVTEDIPVDDQLDEEPTASNPIVSKSVLRRSTRNKQKPDRYGYNLTVASTEQQDPSSRAKARSAPDRDKWEKAMEREMKSLRSNEVWELVKPPPDRKVVGNKWIFK